MLRADPSPRVRAAAAGGLGRYVLAGELGRLEAPIQSRIMTELLTVLRMAKESVQVRRRAIESAAYACTPDVHDALEIAYYDEDESMRLSAVVGMGRSCDERWQPILVSELTSQSPAMRYEATLACGELGLEPAVPMLGRLLGDPDRLVSGAAVWALGQIGGDRSKEILLAAYDSADEDLQAAADEALAEHALAEADVDLLLYDVEGELDPDPFEDEFDFSWSGDEEADDEIDSDVWDNGGP
jgi:HEAT repeat protein